MTSTINHDEPGTHLQVMADMVCTSCACLCDDIDLVIRGDRIVEARNACPLGAAGLLKPRADDGPACLIDGRPARFDEAVDRSARILAGARFPVIFGLGETTTEAQRAAILLGIRIAASVDSGGREPGTATTAALQSVGQVTCTLGEIKNRADFILVWLADPLESHPRLFSRYALDPAGLFVPGGRGSRYCAIVDTRETRSAREAANQFVGIREGAAIEALWTLRALAKGIELDAGAVTARTGVALADWLGLIDRMRAARYGVVFYGAGGVDGRPGHLMAQGVHSLTRDLNATTRFVCMPLTPGGGNAVGARNVLTWSTGHPVAMSLLCGDPRRGSGEFGADAALRPEEADAALIISGDPERVSIPHRIVLTSDRDIPPPGAAVVFRTAPFGISTTGTVYRMDGVPLPLRAALPSPFPSDEEVVRAIEQRVRSIAPPSAASSGGPGTCP